METNAFTIQFWEDTQEFFNGDGFRDLPRYLFVEHKEMNGYPGYKIFEDGRVWSDTAKRFLKPNKDTSGYHQTAVTLNKRKITLLTHRIVAIHFIPNPDGHKFINHKSLKKNDNRTFNLEWMSRHENTKHWVKARGNNYKPPMPASKKAEIMKAIKSGMSQKDVREKFSVSVQTVWRMKHGSRTAKDRTKESHPA